MQRLTGLLLLLAWLQAASAGELSETGLLRVKRAPSELKLGVVLPSDDLVTRLAVNVSITTANSYLQNTAPDYQLIPAFEPYEEGSVFSAVTAACRLIDKGVVALLGPTDPNIGPAIKPFAVRFNIPYLELTSNGTEVEPTVAVNVYPQQQAINKIIHRLISDTLDWNNFMIVHSGPESFWKYIGLISEFVGHVQFRQWSSSAPSANAVMIELRKSDVRRFLVDIPVWDVRDFLIMAFAQNMTGQQYQFIFTNFTFKMSVGANIFAFRLANSQPGSVTKRFLGVEFSQFCNNLTKHYRVKAALIHDSVMVLAKGLAQLSRSKAIIQAKRQREGMCFFPQDEFPQIWPLGFSLVNAMKSIEEEDAVEFTGRMRFDRNGYRSTLQLGILVLTENGFKVVESKRSGWLIPPSTESFQRHMKKPYVLKVLTKIVSGLIWLAKKKDHYDKPISTPDGWEGFCIDLLKMIALRAGFNFTITVMDSYDSLVNELHAGRGDLAMASLSITLERDQLIDFSTPFMNVGTSILFVKPSAQKPSLFSFLQPLSGGVWASVLLTYVLITVGHFVISRMSAYEWQNPHPCEEDSDETENQFTILSSFWFYGAALLNQGTDIAPHATSTRMLTGIWWFFALIIISTYTANLAAFLTVDNTKSEIESVEELANQEKVKYGSVKDGSTAKFFTNSTFETYRKMGEYMTRHADKVFVSTTEEGVARVRGGGYAFLLESSMNDYYRARHCELRQVGSTLDSKGYGVGLPKGSPWREKISQAILELQKSQKIGEIKRNYWDKYNITKPCTSSNEASKEASPLGVEQVGGVFIMLLLGFGLAIIVAIVEFWTKARHHYSGKQLLVVMWHELKFAMRCMTSSKKAKAGTILEKTQPVTINQLKYGIELPKFEDVDCTNASKPPLPPQLQEPRIAANNLDSSSPDASEAIMMQPNRMSEYAPENTLDTAMWVNCSNRMSRIQNENGVERREL